MTMTATTVQYVVEYVQTDPADSPTPGLGHHAGETRHDTPADMFAAGAAAIGKPVPEGAFWPCCDWQCRDTLVTGVRYVALDSDGNERAEWNDGDETWKAI